VAPTGQIFLGNIAKSDVGHIRVRFFVPFTLANYQSGWGPPVKDHNRQRNQTQRELDGHFVPPTSAISVAPKVRIA
jgi:hypothetical protein